MKTDPELIGQILLEKGFETWFRYMFRMITGQPFIIDPIHKDLFSVFDDVYNLKTLRQTINIPPRSAKSTLAKYFIIYSWTINPRCNFIYTSYSQMLVSDFSREIMAIMESDVYKAMYPIKADVLDENTSAVDEFWFEYKKTLDRENSYSTKKIVTYAGGVCLFSSMGSTITGFGCFDYDTIVLTEQGYKKIGEIVENKENIKIWSYNFETNKRELKPIIDYIKNENSDFLEITLSTGEVIRCTPEHPFYLKDGNTLIANMLNVGDELFSESSNIFNLWNRYIKPLYNRFSSVVFIKNKFNIFNRKSFKKIIKSCSASSLKSKTLCNFTPNSTTFNIRNRRRCYPIVFSNFFISSFIFSNFNSLFRCEFLEFPILIKLIISVCLSITILKIFKSVITRIRVFVPNFVKIFRSFSNKCSQYQIMNKISTFFSRRIFTKKCNSFISFFSGLLFNNRIRPSAVYNSIFTNIISFKKRNVTVINIVKCNHKNSSYCLAIKDNNNLYIGRSQQLIHNCGVRGSKGFSGCIIIDDAQKPADINSLVLRTKTNNYFAETLLSRVNDSNVPILNIQQRLHFEDISGFLEKEYGFNTLKKPLVLEDGSCTIPSQYTAERIEELQKSTIVFSAQYQQEPVPEGGLLIKMEKFNRYRLYPERFDSLFICCDTAFSEKKTADNSAFMLMGIIGKERYILDVYCKKVTFVDLRKDLLSFYHKALNDFGRTSNFSNIYIENKASGISLIQQLRSEGLPILEISPTVQNKQLQKDQITDKYTRFLEIESDIESGYCWLPEQASWLNELEEQFIHFDGGNQVTHDDIVDSFIYCLKVARRYQLSDWDAFADAFR